VNKTNEDVLVTQKWIPGQSGPYCFTSKQGEAVNYEVPYGSGWQGIGVTSKYVYDPDLLANNEPTLMEFIPAVPPPPPSVACSTGKIPWMWILIGISVLAVALIIFLRMRIPKVNIMQEVQSPTSDVMNLLDAPNKARKTFAVGTIFSLLGVAVVFLMWCFGEGPCSSQATCSDCNRRGTLWSYGKPRSGGWWNTFLCNFLGRCECTSDILDRSCKAFATQAPGTDFQWDTSEAPGSFPCPTHQVQIPHHGIVCVAIRTTWAIVWIAPSPHARNVIQICKKINPIHFIYLSFEALNK